MSWNNCRKCVFVPRSSFTSALFKVLLTLKLLHGTRAGFKGSTIEDIAMYMIKYFCLDGDIKSQVTASIKYGVKLNFIQKKKDKFSLIMPASSIHLAPCKLKNSEIERIQCIFPSEWDGNKCQDECGGPPDCCGKRPRLKVSCNDDDDDDMEDDGCYRRRPRRPPRPQYSDSCSKCASPKRARTKARNSMTPCPSPCKKPRARPANYCQECQSSGQEYCKMCPPKPEPEPYPDTFKNCACCSK